MVNSSLRCIHACLGNVDQARLTTLCNQIVHKFNPYIWDASLPPQAENRFWKLCRIVHGLWFGGTWLCSCVWCDTLSPAATTHQPLSSWHAVYRVKLNKLPAEIAQVCWPVNWGRRGKPSSFVSLCPHLFSACTVMSCAVFQSRPATSAVSKVLPTRRRGRCRQDPVVHLSPNKQGHVS